MPRHACYRLAFRTPQHDGLHAFAIELFNPLVPLMPNLELAVIMLLARNVLSQLNIPTRQSYTMAVVDLD